MAIDIGWVGGISRHAVSCIDNIRGIMKPSLRGLPVEVPSSISSFFFEGYFLVVAMEDAMSVVKESLLCKLYAEKVCKHYALRLSAS